MNILIRLIVSGLAVFIASYLLPGVKVDSFLTAIIVSVILGIINTIIKPILILLTLPINILTLGLFTLVINALLVLLADSLVPGFEVDGLLWALIFSLVVSIVGTFLRKLGDN